ncbi:hypothetical protein Ccrd_025103 [Cynara cardunculus var. scolymus]|uniref:Uncharacterized protein n=1 Tax=Cynara cardunculus var. scolymus TaxID=59895 RepID=A0A103XBF9_CYNCS|nr:hypothetical protein Ccrd_025103 [Cynara cardunculus var. scolymus]
MSASQLLRILKTVPAGADDVFCAYDSYEQEANMNKSSRCTNPFLSNEENVKGNVWNNPELECSIFGNDFTNNHEDEKFRKSLAAACNVPTHLFGNTTGFYIDRKSVEYELPELMVCYKESDFHVKSICIDEGICDDETILIDENNCEFLCNYVAVNEDDGMIEANLDTEFSNNCADDFPKGAIARSEAAEVGQNGKTTDISNKNEMDPESIHEETQIAVKHQDVANQMHYSEGEACFSMAGSISGPGSCELLFFSATMASNST